jgi:hypothetical protein
MTSTSSGSEIHANGDINVAPELEGLNLTEKADGPGAAAMLAAGMGIFVLGFFTTAAVISSSIKDFLLKFEWGQGVGPLAGKTTLATIVFFGSWAILHSQWRTKDIDIKKVFTVGLILGLLGAIGTFPPFFEAFE